jgi:hypothetical protein
MGAVGRSRAVRQSGDQAVRLSVLGIRLPAMENTTFPRPSPLVEPGTRYRVPGVRYRIPGTWNRISGTGCGPTPRTEHRAQLLENAHPGYASCILHTPCAGFSRTGTRYRVPAIWHLGPGTRHRSRIDAEDRTPSTEDRARPPENAHTGFASCIPHLTSRAGLIDPLPIA